MTLAEIQLKGTRMEGKRRAPAEETEPKPAADESNSSERSNAASKQKVPTALEKCECPPGCIGLPCCT